MNPADPRYAGRGAGGTGPGWPKTFHDELRLPNGRRVGDTDNETLRTEFGRMQIPGFNHSLGRQAAIELYAKHIDAIAQAGGADAVNKWLFKNKEI